MSKLEELIKELCPDGVEYKEIREVGTMIRGNGLQKKDFCSAGVGCIHYGQIYTHYKNFAYKTKSFVSQELAEKLKKVNTGDLVIAITSENVEDVCKSVAWLGDEEIVTGGHCAIFKHKQNPKYLVYYFQTEEFYAQKRKIANGTKVIEVSPRKLEELKVPVPPLPVQNEIVRILDNFTELTAELKTQLATELAARKKQYEYYRVKLLTFGDEIERVSIGDICDVLTGGEAPENTIKGDVSDESHPYPVFGNGKEVYGYTDSYRVDKDAVVISSIGANTGAVYYRKAFFTPIIRLKVIVPKTSEISNRYLFHAVSITSFSSKSSSVPNMNANDIKKAIIPLPPFEVQERVAYMLDEFDAFCTDLNEDVPAEIAARTKQYEYYRDKLLTFPERA